MKPKLYLFFVILYIIIGLIGNIAQLITTLSYEIALKIGLAYSIEKHGEILTYDGRGEAIADSIFAIPWLLGLIALLGKKKWGIPFLFFSLVYNIYWPLRYMFSRLWLTHQGINIGDSIGSVLGFGIVFPIVSLLIIIYFWNNREFFK